MKLYEISEEILKCVDEDGEIFDIEKYESLALERDAKIENIALWIKNLESDIESLKNEKMEFAKRQKSAEYKRDSLKQYLSSYLNGQKFESTKCKISFRKSASVDVVDVYKIPEEYLKSREPEADKTLIKEAIKKGIEIDGVQIIETSNIQVK